MAKTPKATRTSLSLPGELYARLQAEQERTGAPLAEIVRRACDQYLTPREQAASRRRMPDPGAQPMSAVAWSQMVRKAQPRPAKTAFNPLTQKPKGGGR